MFHVFHANDHEGCKRCSSCMIRPADCDLRLFAPQDRRQAAMSPKAMILIVDDEPDLCKVL